MESYERYVGTTLDGRYNIEKVVGVGGMAVVFRGYDKVAHRTVAIKMLQDHIAKDDDAVKRFINESKAVAMLSHPNIVSIYDVSMRGQQKYIVMEYLEGITLRSYMSKTGAMSTQEIVGIMGQILKALIHAHERGIAHRDIKPQNIMLLPDGSIKVTDFGIAQLPQGESLATSELAVGTAYYISPEQASGQKSDYRADIYSAGAMLYEMATGVLPFNAKTPLETAMLHVTSTPVMPSKIKRDIPRGLEQIIMTAMEKSPSRRFQSAEQMYRWLETLGRDPSAVFKPLLPPIVEKKNKKKKHHRKKQKNYLGASMLPIILGVAFAFLFACIISAYYLWTYVLFNDDLDKSYVMTVDNFIGTSYYVGLEDELSAKDYRVEVEYVYNSELPMGTIFEQEPAAGERRRVESGKRPLQLHLTVSRGTETFVLPEFLMQDYRTVEDTLTKMYGLRVQIVDDFNTAVATGLVYGSDPTSGSTVSSGDTVTLYVSKGAEIKTHAVPDFTGMTERAARVAVEENGLKVGNVTYEYSSSAEGTVIRQSRVAFTTVTEGTAVDFVVSLGPEPVVETEPPVTETPIPEWPWF